MLVWAAYSEASVFGQRVFAMSGLWPLMVTQDDLQCRRFLQRALETLEEVREKRGVTFEARDTERLFDEYMAAACGEIRDYLRHSS